MGNKKLLFLGLMCMVGTCFPCDQGFQEIDGETCVDMDECEDIEINCGINSHCFNSVGSYYCQCQEGYKNSKGGANFTSLDGQCQDINECRVTADICGPVAYCNNLIGNYTCTCHLGYTISGTWPGDCKDINECKEAEMTKENICGEKGTCNNSDGSYWCECPQGYTTNDYEWRPCSDINECQDPKMPKENICGEKGTCNNTVGSYWCECPQGYTTYGNERMPCSELDCDGYRADGGPAESLRGLADILFMMRNSCLALSNPSATGEKKADGEKLLKKLFTAAEAILTPGHLDSREHVSALLHTVEKSIMLIGPQLTKEHAKQTTNETDVEIAVRKGMTRPAGPVHLSNEDARLDTDWETATGTGTYPGFALAALLTYKNLNIAFDGSFEGLNEQDENGVNATYRMSSKVVSVVVSNPSTQQLSRSVNVTFRHLEDKNESNGERYICVYWNERGAWSTVGCRQSSNASYTVCTCDHLSSFAVLMAQFDMDHPFALILLTKIGLIISILCLILSILTFKFCRSIQGTRTVIHLHLSICLLMGDLIFLAGISQTEPVGGCRFVAAMLHYSFLAVFAWMLLEGVQLYRMVVLVFNATIQPLYLFVTGYGMPLVIVIISAISRPTGYGTKKHCWLSLENYFIWSFFGPACIVIVVNVFFFIITVWKLAQKFTSLNPDFSQLHKIKAFTVTAIAQMCILGLMWVFGAFLFERSTFTTVASYIFTILNSLQGALVLIMHCLLSKQVREEYAHFLSCICPTQKKSYSDLSSTNPSSTQSQGSRSGQHTGESQI